MSTTEPTNFDPIVVEQTFNAPAERVWRAITDKTEMPKWFFAEIKDFRPEKGFDTTFDVKNEANGKVYPHHWTVTDAVPNQKLVYDWLYDGYLGSSWVKWELTSLSPTSTRLKLTHTGIQTFPQDDEAFTAKSCRGGWEYFFGRLKTFVEG
jgi:uncharacterized protein YndB with AHSA1/START domain